MDKGLDVPFNEFEGNDVDVHTEVLNNECSMAAQVSNARRQGRKKKFASAPPLSMEKYGDLAKNTALKHIALAWIRRRWQSRLTRRLQRSTSQNVRNSAQHQSHQFVRLRISHTISNFAQHQSHQFVRL